MFDGLELDVILYDEYVDALMGDEDEDEDDGDLSVILRQEDSDPDITDIFGNGCSKEGDSVLSNICS